MVKDKIIIPQIKKLFPGKTVLSIVDYAEKNIYVVHAVPKGKENEKWLDGNYAVSRTTLDIAGGFASLDNEPEVFFNLPKDRVIYSAEK